MTVVSHEPSSLLLNGGVHIISVGDTEADVQSVSRIVLSEGRGQAIVESRLKAFDGTDDRNVGSIAGLVCRPGSWRGVVPPSGRRSETTKGRVPCLLQLRVSYATDQCDHGIPDQADSGCYQCHCGVSMA